MTDTDTTRSHEAALLDAATRAHAAGVPPALKALAEYSGLTLKTCWLYRDRLVRKGAWPYARNGRVFARTRSESAMLEAAATLAADGRYPSTTAVAARSGIDQATVTRYRAKLHALGQWPHEIRPGYIESAAPRPPKPERKPKVDRIGLTLEAAVAIDAEGRRVTLVALAGRLDVHQDTVRKWVRELEAEGRWRWPITPGATASPVPATIRPRREPKPETPKPKPTPKPTPTRHERSVPLTVKAAPKAKAPRVEIEYRAPRPRVRSKFNEPMPPKTGAKLVKALWNNLQRGKQSRYCDTLEQWRKRAAGRLHG